LTDDDLFEEIPDRSSFILDQFVAHHNVDDFTQHLVYVYYSCDRTCGFMLALQDCGVLLLTLSVTLQNYLAIYACSMMHHFSSDYMVYRQFSIQQCTFIKLLHYKVVNLCVQKSAADNYFKFVM